MPERINSQYAGNVGKPRPIFVHGRLLPVEAVYYKWADKDQNKQKIEGTGGEVPSYAEWVKLPESKRGQKWIFSVDQKMFRPDFEKPTSRGIMVDFNEWQQYTLPSILDTVGTGEKAVGEFLDRAEAGNWFIEAEMVHTGYYNEKPQNTFKFTRMTQDEAEIRAWNEERYGKAKETEVPQEAIEQGKLIWTKMAKGNTDKFNTLINGDAELSPYLIQFAANDYEMVK